MAKSVDNLINPYDKLKHVIKSRVKKASNKKIVQQCLKCHCSKVVLLFLNFVKLRLNKFMLNVSSALSQWTLLLFVPWLLFSRFLFNASKWISVSWANCLYDIVFNGCLIVRYCCMLQVLETEIYNMSLYIFSLFLHLYAYNLHSTLFPSV